MLACPFGVPKYVTEFDQMMKCDMCYDRTAFGKKPMCATVCPSEALYFGTRGGMGVAPQGHAGQRVPVRRADREDRASHMVMPEPVERVDVKIGDIRRRRPAPTPKPRRAEPADRGEGAGPAMSETIRERPVERWREDFPVEWERDNRLTRREFTKFLIAVSGVAAAGNGLIALQTSRPRVEYFPRVEIAPVADVPVGGVKLFRYPTENNPAILIRLGEDRYAAYLQACTHLSCPVTYSEKSGRIECPCHHGVFEAETGAVVSGPPPRPLPQHPARAVETAASIAEGIEDV